LLEAGFIAATILWIIFPALCIHELQAGSGRLDVLRKAIERLSPDPRMKAILIGWFLALFLEGAAGFGTPIALTAPIRGSQSPPLPPRHHAAGGLSARRYNSGCPRT
jgi:lactate permease